MSTVAPNHSAQAAAAAPSLVTLAEVEGRGRALLASQPLKAGQIVLTDSPILLYSAFPFTSLPPLQYQQQQHHYCAHCFRTISNSTPLRCPSCSSAAAQTAVLFCSPNCQSIALASSHSPWVCQTLIRLSHPSSPLLLHQQDRQIQARFLVAAYNLTLIFPSNFQTLLSLHGGGPNCHPDEAAVFLHSLLSSLCPPLPTQTAISGFSLELTVALLAKDKLNAFGLMEPFAEEKERSVRAYGIYPKASFFNHDCLPNACRFEYIDARSTANFQNTEMIVRIIHDIPEGREICLSYFPVNLKYSERQRRLREDYGFVCECDRCKVEANWSDEEDEALEEDGKNDEGEDEGMEEDIDECMVEEGENAGDNDDNNDFPHAYFFIRYMCNRNNCWGTLAPLPPIDTSPSTVMECNVCGNLKKNEEFMDGAQ